MHFIFIILFTITINTTSSIANSISYYNFECNGVLRTNDVTTIAKWNINFINSNRATLDLYYDDKKKSADLRISIQKIKIFMQMENGEVKHHKVEDLLD